MQRLAKVGNEIKKKSLLIYKHTHTHTHTHTWHLHYITHNGFWLNETLFIETSYLVGPTVQEANPRFKIRLFLYKTI